MRSTSRQGNVSGTCGRSGGGHGPAMPSNSETPKPYASQGSRRQVSVSSCYHDESSHSRSGHEPEYPPIGTELTVMYFAFKDETFQLKKNYKRFKRFLKSKFSCGVIPLRDDLGDGLLPFSNLVIIAGLNVALSQTEVRLLLEYVESGGSVLVLAESNRDPDLYNAFTSHFGIKVIKDSVISVVRMKQYHPKECYISKAINCPALLPRCGSRADEGDEGQNLNILFPHGCSLEVSDTAIPVIASGNSSYPSSRPLGAIYYNAESRGRVIVYGSGHSFTDQYIEMEDNQKLLEVFLEMSTTEYLPELETTCDMDLREHEDFHCTGNKAGRFRGVLHDIDEHIFPGYITPIGSIKPLSLVPPILEKTDYKLLPTLFKAYEQLKIDRIPLSQIVKPQFEIALPPLKLAVFPPTFRLLPPPPLELFDLDDDFSSLESRLGRIANKCTENDLEFCVDAIGNLLDVSVDPTEEKEKMILYKMFTSLVNFKLSTNWSSENLSQSSLSMIEDKYFDESGEDIEDGGDGIGN